MKRSFLTQCVILNLALLCAVSPAFACIEDGETLSTLFKALDTNGDGVIVKTEYIDFSTQATHDVFRQTGACNEICLEKKFDKMDTDHNGKVDWNEFRSYYASLPPITVACSY